MLNKGEGGVGVVNWISHRFNNRAFSYNCIILLGIWPKQSSSTPGSESRAVQCFASWLAH